MGGSVTPKLAKAALRLRGVPGFPRAIGRPRRSDSVVTAPADARVNGADAVRPPASQASAQGDGTHEFRQAEAPWPRLLTLPAASAYLGLGMDVTRELASTGALRAARVTVPAPTTHKRKGGRIALVLLDRLEVDRLVTAWRDTP
jgi:hypothetical protein